LRCCPAVVRLLLLRVGNTSRLPAARILLVIHLDYDISSGKKLPVE
jgi:hypothetical protein